MTRARPSTFDAVLELLPWGRNVYTIIKVPEELADQARAAGTRRLEGTFNDVVVNVGTNHADILPDTFVYVGQGLQQRLGARAGDVVRCQLAPADPDHVPVPQDVAETLAAAGRRDAFERRSAAERRRLLAPIEGAARPATRERRIAALIAALPVD